MKPFVFMMSLVMTLNLMAVYNIGDIVDSTDNLSWTDNYGYFSTIFDEIVTQHKVVLIFWGGDN